MPIIAFTASSNAVVLEFNQNHIKIFFPDFIGIEEQECQCGILLSEETKSRRNSNYGDILKDTKIIGGINADLNAIPWQIGISNGLRIHPFCGGSIIGPKTIITAAHCVDHIILDFQIQKLQIVTGLTNLENIKDRLNRY